MDENQNLGPDLSENTQSENQQAYTNAQEPQFQQPNYQQPPFQQPIPPQPPMGYNQKSKIAAGLLGIFLGAFGVHNFYLGFTGKAVAQLLITVLTCGFGGIVTEIWGLIEGIIILTSNNPVDANGVPLSN